MRLRTSSMSRGRSARTQSREFALQEEVNLGWMDDNEPNNADKWLELEVAEDEDDEWRTQTVESALLPWR